VADRFLTEQPRIILSSAARGWTGIEAEFLRIPAGLHVVSGEPWHRLGIHFGAAVKADCRCDGRRHLRVQKHGDIDIVPAGLGGSWEDNGDCSILRIMISPALLNRVVADLGHVPAQASLRPAFQVRDIRLEAIIWAIKADLEAEAPSETLYTDSLGVALAVRLLEIGERRRLPEDGERRLTSMQKRRLAEFIESNLDQTLSLPDLAAVLDIGLSQLKTLFRNSFGVPVHRYVVHRRVERARALLLAGELPISQVALEAGFAHQSHMSAWMRRIVGITPGDFVRIRRGT
jgi:AraC family transcriptional regulator